MWVNTMLKTSTVFFLLERDFLPIKMWKIYSPRCDVLLIRRNGTAVDWACVTTDRQHWGEITCV